MGASTSLQEIQTIRMTPGQCMSPVQARTPVSIKTFGCAQTTSISSGRTSFDIKHSLQTDSTLALHTISDASDDLNWHGANQLQPNDLPTHQLKCKVRKTLGNTPTPKQ